MIVTWDETNIRMRKHNATIPTQLAILIILSIEKSTIFDAARL